MTPDPLSPAAVLEAMASALPTHDQGDTTSDLSSSLDCAALFVHACMINLGFRLLGFNEDQKTGAPCPTPCPASSLGHPANCPPTSQKLNAHA